MEFNWPVFGVRMHKKAPNDSQNQVFHQKTVNMWTNVNMRQRSFSIFFSPLCFVAVNVIKNKLDNIGPFSAASDTPVGFLLINFYPQFPKPGWIPCLFCFPTCVQ